MPNMPKQAGDPVLCRDGSVEVEGVKVGFWIYRPPDELPPAYDFSFTKGGEIVFGRLFKQVFKADLPKFLESVSRLPENDSPES